MIGAVMSTKKVIAIKRLKEEIDHARDSLGTSQEQIAERAGIDPVTLSRIVTGSTEMPRMATWRKIERPLVFRRDIS